MNTDPETGEMTQEGLLKAATFARQQTETLRGAFHGAAAKTGVQRIKEHLAQGMDADAAAAQAHAEGLE